MTTPEGSELEVTLVVFVPDPLLQGVVLGLEFVTEGVKRLPAEISPEAREEVDTRLAELQQALADTNHGVGHGFHYMEPGKRYRVTRAFTDFDRQEHPVGETWTYIGTALLPYDDGRSIFVSLDGEREWHIRMQDRAEEQGPVLDALEAYVVAV